MKPVRIISGLAVPLPLDDVNTDVIIPMQALLSGDRAKMTKHAFRPLRYLPNGVPNPDFPLNNARYKSGSILVVGENFGCGSSREMAVWVIADLGIRCILAKSFNDLFEDNCFKNGLPAIALPSVDIDRLCALAIDPSKPELELTVDIGTITVSAGKATVAVFALGAARREGLLRGMDPISNTTRYLRQIEEFWARDRDANQWIGGTRLD